MIILIIISCYQKDYCHQIKIITITNAAAIFFVGIAYDISNLIGEGILSNPIAIQKGREYLQYIKNRDFSKFSTQEDIDIVNKILDVMIKELS